jgi:hypothetical protein
MPTPPDKIRGRLLQGCIAVETIRFTGETVRPFPKIHKNRLLQKKRKLQAVFFVRQTPPGAFFVQNFGEDFAGIFAIVSWYT